MHNTESTHYTSYMLYNYNDQMHTRQDTVGHKWLAHK